MNSLPQIFFNNSELYENKKLFSFKVNSNWQHLSWKDTKNLVLNISSALHEIGVKKNDKISIIADNSYKWCAVDLATTISLGAITVPGYTTSNEEEISYLLSHSETSIVFVNAKLLSLILKILPGLNKIKHVICIDDINTSKFKKFNIGFYTFNELLNLGSKSYEKFKIIERFVSKINENDVVSIIYTSGTSNKPKGVMLTHKSIISNIVGANELVSEIKIKDHKFLSIIPLSHAYEHTAGFFLSLIHI